MEKKLKSVKERHMQKNMDVLFYHPLRSSPLTAPQALRGRIQSTGRSMVEMLGVLAIVGVLSAGALSGYSKAMMQHRLNVQQEQINQIVTAITRYQNDLYANNAQNILKALNEIPLNMIKENNAIEDIFHNYVAISSGSDTITLFVYVNGANTSSVGAARQCQNLIQIAKNWSSELQYIETLSGYGSEDVRASVFIGDSQCTNNSRCMKNLTVSDIQSMCALHQGNQAVMELKFWWSK